MFAEVIFPLKVKTFTYKIPSGAPDDLIGRIVKAPLSNREAYGLIGGVKESVDTGISKTKKIKDILTFYGHLGSPSLIPFWGGFQAIILTQLEELYPAAFSKMQLI
jgi:primosomal protein N'